MSKKLNTNDIVNELENSSFFPQRQSQARQPVPAVEPPAPVAPTPVPLATPQPRRAVVRPKEAKPSPQAAKTTPSAERGYVRRTFDIFEDQLAYLRRVSLEDQLAGGEGSMNAMVRDALDAYITKRRKEVA